MKKARLHTLTALFLATLLFFTACGQNYEEIPETTISTEASVDDTVPMERKTRTVPDTITTEVFVGEMTIISSTVYSYDDQGLLKEIIAYSNGVENTRTTVENDTNGEVVHQSSVSNGITTITDSENIYDDAGNLVQKTDTVTIDGVVSNIREYTYNSDHTLAKAQFRSLGDQSYTTSNTYEYDVEGRQILELREDSSGTVTHIETEYNDLGLNLRTIYKNDSGMISHYTENIYEDNGAVKQVTYAADGTLSPSYTLTTRNEYGNPLTAETYNGEVLAMRTTYTYITVPAFK